MSEKITVGVVFGGRSIEHEVSLVSAASIMQALDKTRYTIVPIGISKDGRWFSSSHALEWLRTGRTLDELPECYLSVVPGNRSLILPGNNERIHLDVIFPVVHGIHGEDGTLQGLFELAEIPYVGGGVLASSVGMDKIVQKQLHKQAGLPIVKYVWFLSRDCASPSKKMIAQIEHQLRYPVFVKPANTGSSVAISKAHNRNELIDALKTASGYDRKVIIEQGVKNVREIECSVMGNDDPIASIPGEVIPSNEFYDYDAKYVDGKSEAVIPARLSRSVVREVQEIAVHAFREMDCAGMARVDFFVTPRNKIYLNELNTIPGFTSISMYPKLWEASGVPYPELLNRLIALALQRHAEKLSLATSYKPKREWFAG